MTIVRLEDVHLRFGSTPVLTGVDLDVAAGERVGIAGPNGAGKSTLLSVIATLRTPTTGTATVFDAEVGSPRAYEVRRLIGWSGHEPALFEELTLRENLHHFARLAGLDVSDADRALRQVGLDAAADRRAQACSNGMRRRADLARLLMTRPRLLLLDEAHAGLDADAAAIVEVLCRRTVAAGGAVVMVSHDREAMTSHVDRVLTLREGRVER
ncbi:MAG: heme ABC exporter ATP-binding protein CcmA [Actinomycetes bacterium]|jgi:heme exporter protein A|nr:heme ABC exporter ATP-binding protein CcmA [Acidimicrobiia bacterium]